ncbi:hypothetical protein GJ496_006436 [Pomphorhynchus laevis]|nr:hypothetical protein GJ496_006436 [Pomphorhynchus laevis]
MSANKDLSDRHSNLEYETVSTLFYKLTSPTNDNKLDRDLLALFCRKIDCEPAGRLVALQVMIHKIQSPCESEALIALDVLKVCAESCDVTFRHEIGKFKFLNELIKVLSPKYLGNRSTDKVKKKISELFYSWTLLMPAEKKIAEAYRLLKKQNLTVGNAERDTVNRQVTNESKRRVTSVFNDKDRTKHIADLLKSSNPSALVEANRLIKRMALEEELRMEKLYNRTLKVHSFRTSAQVFEEIIEKFDCSLESFNLLQTLYGELKQYSSTLQSMATESDEIDDKLGEVLEVNDLILHALNRFECSNLRESIKSETASQKESSHEDVSKLIDLYDEPRTNDDLISAGDSLMKFSLRETEDDNTCKTSESVSSLPTMQILSKGPNITCDSVLQIADHQKSVPKSNTSTVTKDVAAMHHTDNDHHEQQSSTTENILNEIYEAVTKQFLSSATVDRKDSIGAIKTALLNESLIHEANKSDVEVVQTASEPPSSISPVFSSIIEVNLSDFHPVNESLKTLDHNGLRLSIYQGYRISSVPADCNLILLTIENHQCRNHVTELEANLKSQNIEILSKQGSKIGDLLPYNPPLPISSYIQLFLLRIINQRSNVEYNIPIEVDVTYKIGSERHYLHTDYCLSKCE